MNHANDAAEPSGDPWTERQKQYAKPSQPGPQAPDLAPLLQQMAQLSQTMLGLTEAIHRQADAIGQLVATMVQDEEHPDGDAFPQTMDTPVKR